MPDDQVALADTVRDFGMAVVAPPQGDPAEVRAPLIRDKHSPFVILAE